MVLDVRTATMCSGPERPGNRTVRPVSNFSLSPGFESVYLVTILGYPAATEFPCIDEVEELLQALHRAAREYHKKALSRYYAQIGCSPIGLMPEGIPPSVLSLD
jgi:hypothetical protein